jgi:ribosome biogenesis GTPase A
MFLGDTKTGKSTTIHFLAGSKMRKVILNGIDHIEPDPDSIKI